MKMKALFLTISAVIIAIVLSQAPAAADSPDTVKSLSRKGVLFCSAGSGNTLCVINTGYENGAYWFRVKEGGENCLIGNNLTQLAEVHELSVSPNKAYLAVLSVGEGHPVIEVIDLKKLASENKYSVLQIVDPYPGTLQIKRWKGSHLIFNCDVPIDRRNKDGRVDSNTEPSVVKAYSLDMATGKISSIRIN